MEWCELLGLHMQMMTNIRLIENETGSCLTTLQLRNIHRRLPTTGQQGRTKAFGKRFNLPL